MPRCPTEPWLHSASNGIDLKVQYNACLGFVSCSTVPCVQPNCALVCLDYTQNKPAPTPIDLIDMPWILLIGTPNVTTPVQLNTPFWERDEVKGHTRTPALTTQVRYFPSLPVNPQLIPLQSLLSR